MRRALASLAILMMLVVPVAAAAQQTPLAADLLHGIVVWDTPITLYKRNGAPPMVNNGIIVGADDVRKILAWPGDTVYVVVYVSGIDLYAGRPVPLNVIIKSGIAAIGNTVYATDYQNIPRAGVYEFAIPKDAIRRAAEVSGSIMIVLHIYDGWSVSTGDNYYAVSINKVVVAPPQGVAPDKPATHAQPMRAGIPSNAVALAVAGGAAIALAVLAAYAVSRRR